MTVRRGPGGLIEVPYGHPNVDSVWVVDESAGDEKEFANFIYMTTKKRLNEMSSFEIKFIDVQTADKAWIEEGNTVKIFDESRLVMRGMIEEVTYDSDYECTVRGYGMEAKLLHRILLTRTDYYTTATAVSTIVTALLADVAAISAGDNSISTTVSVRFEYDNRLRNLMDMCKAFGYDWWVSTKSDGNEEWPFDTDYLHVKDGRGSGVSKKTFYTGGDNQNAEIAEKLVDKSNMVNDITCLGYGDGINQLSSHTTSVTSISTYGTVDRTFVDKTILNQATLDAWRNDIVEDYSAPIVRISLKVYDVHFDTEIHCGDTITINDTATGLSSTYSVVGIVRTYSDEIGEELIYECSNVRVSFESELADVQREARAPAVYAQGSTVTDNLSEKENLDDSVDLDMKFYLPADIIRINKALLSFNIESFRAYTDEAQSAPDAGSHQHTIPGHDHTLFTHSSDTAGGYTDRKFTCYGLYVDIATDMASTDIKTDTTDGSTTATASGVHSHTVTLNFGIAEDTAPSTSVVVTGGYVGSESAVTTTSVDVSALDITTTLSDAYVANGAGWYNIKFDAEENMRIEANLFLKYFIRSET